MRLALSHFWPPLVILPAIIVFVCAAAPESRESLALALGLVEVITFAVAARTYHLDKKLRAEMDAEFKRIAARFEERQGSEW